MNRLSRRWTPSLLVVVLAPLTLVSCDSEDPIEAALAQVQRELASVHPGGTAMADPATRAGVYTRAIATLGDAARAGSDAQRDAAGLLLASAHEGLSRIDADEATELEARLLDRATRLRAQVDLFAGQSALAAALGAIDPQAERDTLDGALADSRAQSDTARSTRESLQTELDDLAARAQTQTDVAHKKNAQAGRVRSASLDAAPDEAQRLAKQAYEIRRQAARAEVAASELHAEADKIRPRLAEQDLLINSLRDEQAGLTEARHRVDTSVQDAEQQSQDARAAARQAGESAGAALDEIDSLRTGALAKAWDSAIREAQAAVDSASRARGIERTTLAIRRGETQQRVGELQAARARGLERYDALLSVFQQADPELPFADRLTEIRARISGELDASRGAARDAYKQAVAAYRGASTRDQTVRGRLERVEKILAGDDAEAPADQSVEHAGAPRSRG